MSVKGNQNAIKHGGKAAIDRIRDGGEFTGPAREKLQLVEQELEQDGVESIIERNAKRLQAATDLYFDALVKAAQDGNAALFDGYAGRYGWLAAKTLLAWRDVRQQRKQKGAPAIDAVLRDYESGE